MQTMGLVIGVAGCLKRGDLAMSSHQRHESGRTAVVYKLTYARRDSRQTGVMKSRAGGAGQSGCAESERTAQRGELNDGP